jgi:anti-sigma factor RsiW
MSDPGEQAGDAALWWRWRREAQPEAGEAAALELAAYAEGRLDESQAETVEDWLFAHPDAIADLAAARAAAAAPLPQAPEAMILRAAALVAPSPATILPFGSRAPAPRRPWRMAIAWGSIAASLLATSLVGFAIGDSAYLDFAPTGQPSAESALHELLDPPGAIFTDDDGPAT